jgi:hypothetical protein
MHSDAVICTRPFCDGPCDADLHETPAALQVIINEFGSPCPQCQSGGFGFLTECRMDEWPVHFLVLWHADTCPSVTSGGYIIANLPETALKTGDAIFRALGEITDDDVRASKAGAAWADLEDRLRRGERWPVRMIETVRQIAAREARQAGRAKTEAR